MNLPYDTIDLAAEEERRSNRLLFSRYFGRKLPCHKLQGMSFLIIHVYFLTAGLEEFWLLVKGKQFSQNRFW